MEVRELDRLIDKVVGEMVGPTSVHDCGTRTPRCNWCWVCPDCRSQVVEEIVGNGASRVGAGPNLGPIHNDMAKLIDHTLLKPEATRKQVAPFFPKPVEVFTKCAPASFTSKLAFIFFRVG